MVANSTTSVMGLAPPCRSAVLPLAPPQHYDRPEIGPAPAKYHYGRHGLDAHVPTRWPFGAIQGLGMMSGERP